MWLHFYFNMEEKETLQKILNTFPGSKKQIIDSFRMFSYATSTKNRQEMIKLIRKNKNITISELTKKMKMAYKNVFANVVILEESGIIITEKQEKTQGRKVFLKLSPSLEKLF